MALDVVLPESWSDWRLLSVIGEGSFGKVYKAQRQEFGQTFYSAIKILSVPHDKAAIQAARMEGVSDDESLRDYFYEIVEDWINEIRMMEDMKGTPNIVNIQDYKVVEKKTTIGWDIYIRMELLTGFEEILQRKQNLTEEEIIKVGCDICKALEYCQRKNVVHRDIKFANIFVSEFGDYKLGDFGVARHLEKTMSELSQKGTKAYMAPEIFKGGQYDRSVDIYSLGIVLYRLANHGRNPFCPSWPDKISFRDEENALYLRMTGKPLPKPDQASDELAKVILKACEFRAEDRYQSPKEFRHSLEKIKTAENQEEKKVVPIPEPEPDPDPAENTETLDSDEISRLFHSLNGEGRKPVSPEKNQGDPASFLRKKRKKIILSLISVCVCACLATALAVLAVHTNRPARREAEEETPVTVSEPISEEERQEALEMSLESIQALADNHQYQEAQEALDRLEYSLERRDMDTSAMEEKRKEIENAEEAYITHQKYKGIMAKGNDYYEKGQYDKAIEQYRKAKETEKSRAEEVNEKIAKCKEKKKELADAARQEKMNPLGGSGTTGGNTTVTPSPPVGGNSWNNGTGNNSNYNPSGGGSSNTTQKNSGSGTGGGSTSKPSIDFTVLDDENYDFSVD